MGNVQHLRLALASLPLGKYQHIEMPFEITRLINDYKFAVEKDVRSQVAQAEGTL